MNSIIIGTMGRLAIATNVGTLIGASAVLGYNKFMDLRGSVSEVPNTILGGIVEVAKETVSQNGKWVALAGGVLTAGAAYYTSRKIRGCVKDRVMQLKEKVGLQLREQVSPRMNQVVTESLRDNSQEISQTTPKIQIKVGKVVRGSLEVYGSAIRILDCLVMPSHVLTDATDTDNCVVVKGSQGTLRLNAEDFIMLETDLVMRVCSPSEFSRIGMPVVSLYENISARGELVSIVGVQKKGTVGTLQHDPTAFGKVCYLGSTTNGYSGAPYMKGTQVAGVHCWGGRVNGGYSASFIKVLIHRALKHTPESSEDWLQKVFKGKKLDRHSVHFNAGNDEAIIRYNGQYHLIDGDTFRKSRGFDFIDGTYGDEDSQRVEESLRHSGESKSLMQPGASGNSNEPGQWELLVTNLVTKTLSQLTNGQVKRARASAQSSNSQASTSGLHSVQQQN